MPKIQDDRVVIYVSLSFDPIFRRHPLRLHLIEARIELQEVDRKHRSESGILSQNKDKSAIILPRKGSLVFGREYNLVSHLSLPLQPLEEGYKVQKGMCSLGKFRSVCQMFCVQKHKNSDLIVSPSTGTSRGFFQKGNFLTDLPLSSFTKKKLRRHSNAVSL